MAQTYKYGVFARDDLVGVPESVAAGMASLNNISTTFLTAISPNLNNLSAPARDTTHYFYEKQWRPMRTTLNGAFSAVATSVTFADQAFKIGELVAVDEEIIKLTATSDYLTFDCDRSVGSAAAAAHSDGASALGLGKAWVIGSAAGTADMIVQPNKVTQYTQIFKREVGVSKTAQGLDEYHREGGISRYDANVREQMENIRQEMENTILRGVAQAAVANTTEGRMDGVYERLAAASATTSLSAGTPTRENIRSALRTIKDYSGDGVRPDWLFVSDYVKDVIDDWQLPRIQIDPASPFATTYGADVSKLNLGGGYLNVKAMSKIKSHMFLITSQFIRVGPLVNGEFEHTFHGVDGDRIKGFIRGEYTCQVMAPKAHHVFYNVAES